MAPGKINKILTSSFVDGPGNRAVVFLQGCNFNCLYCHNPYTINECIHCGVCVPECPEGALVEKDGRVVWIEEKCTDCDTCISVCPYHSSPKVKLMTPEEVWAQIKPVSPFISGVSVSGGEPALQAEFLFEFFKLVKSSSDLTTLIETNGTHAGDAMGPAMPYLDLVQVDVKAMDAEHHLELTGKPLEPVLEAVRFYHLAGKLFSIQQVIVQGFTASKEQVLKLADFLAAIDPTIPLRLVRFRAHGTLAPAASWDSPEDALMDRLVTAAKSRGLLNVTKSL